MIIINQVAFKTYVCIRGVCIVLLTDGEEETGTVYDEIRDTQEDEFESEEQWRKQRHEREMYLKQMVRTPAD